MSVAPESTPSPESTPTPASVPASESVNRSDPGHPAGLLRQPGNRRPTGPRRSKDLYFHIVCIFVAAISIAVLSWLLFSVFRKGASWLTWDYVTSPPEPDPMTAGIFPAIWGTIAVCTLCALVTLPIGIATAILLEEFKPKTKFIAWLYGLIQLNISNLAGVPSVVYGILGLTAFVSMFGLFESDTPGQPAFELGGTSFQQYTSLSGRSIYFPVDSSSDGPPTLVDGAEAFQYSIGPDGRPIIDLGRLVPIQLNVLDPGDPYPSDQELKSRTVRHDDYGGRVHDRPWYYFRLPLGSGVLAGALTLMLVILPVVIIATQESLRGVPSTLRDGARGLGATPWQVVWNVTLPAATPGIMTGSILAMSRAIGETAPILIIAGVVYIRHVPQHLMDDFTVLPMQIYNWIDRPQEEFRNIAAAGILVLLAILLTFNAIAVLIRQLTQRPLS